MYITFVRSAYLYLILLVPLLIFIHFFTLRGARRKALRFANFEAVSKIRGVDLFSKNLVMLFVSIIIILLFVLLLSGATLHRTVEASSFSFVFAFDTSASMMAQDILPNRLEASKEIVSKLIDSLPISTNVGIVSFSGNSIIEKDLTVNKFDLKNSVRNIQLSPIGGTDIYEAIITSTNLLLNEDEKAIVLLSDGQLNIGNMEEFIDYSRKRDVIVHVIAIGTLEGGETTYGTSTLNEDILKAIAYNTGGIYFKVDDRVELEEAFNSSINLIEKNVSIDMSFYLILSLIILFIFFFILTNTKYRILP